MEIDDFEAKRKKVLEDLKGHRKPGSSRKFNLDEQLQQAILQDKLAEIKQNQSQPKGDLIGLLTISEKVEDYVTREGNRVGQFKIFRTHDELAEWSESFNPRIVILDVDPPMEDNDTMNLYSYLTMTCPKTKICLLTDKSRKNILQQLSKKGILAILSKPIQLLELKHILKGSIPVDCKPLQ